ncbi:hypothetical protein B005_4965 [Nocardiopsis alba ATCC BAA-2165]|uniref:Uncharacterized protein n=1 Tax=Nocardiopsis alba (strain ATCC BAA-2165 / BE74) TaxID=1205910 RepID=J7LA64_NOCAA|nr:hypothetical protein B005_4965 [Nocardiopsis alba ATCC BAA-2165]
MKCTNGNWYFGEWANAWQNSIARCGSGDTAIDHSIDVYD